jgi:hypothetical protein
LCAVNKCPKPIVYIIESLLKEKFPVLANRHNVYGSVEALDPYNPGVDTPAYIDHHWVISFITSFVTPNSFKDSTDISRKTVLQIIIAVIF